MLRGPETRVIYILDKGGLAECNTIQVHIHVQIDKCNNSIRMQCNIGNCSSYGHRPYLRKSTDVTTCRLQDRKADLALLGFIRHCN